MSNVLAFPARPKSIRAIRSRETVLSVLVPKILGILWDRAASDPWKILAEPIVRIERNTLTIGAYRLSDHIYNVRVYKYEASEICDANTALCLGCATVFSARIADYPVSDNRFNYLGGRCDIVNWKRGDWEDRIAADPTEPCSIAHVATRGYLVVERPLFRIDSDINLST